MLLRSDALRQARPGELPALLALLDACALPVADLTAGHLPEFLICLDGDRPIAAGGLEFFGEAILLRSLAVAAEHRRRGLAARLVAALEQRARSAGGRRIYLLTSGASDYFSGRGFCPLARSVVPPSLAASPQFRSLCPASATCMVKALDQIGRVDTLP